MYETKIKQLGQDSKSLPAYLQPSSTHFSVFTTWEMSLQNIQAEDPSAPEILFMCSFFSCEDIPVEMLLKGLPAVTQTSGMTGFQSLCNY